MERTGADIPVVPEKIPVIHFRDALALVGAPEDEPDLAPEHERALGAWALSEHRSDFVAVEGYPMLTTPGREITWGDERLPITHLSAVREEAAAYPVITGPRTLFEVETPRARLALTYQHRSRRWTVTALDRAA